MPCKTKGESLLHEKNLSKSIDRMTSKPKNGEFLCCQNDNTVAGFIAQSSRQETINALEILAYRDPRFWMTWENPIIPVLFI